MIVTCPSLRYTKEVDCEMQTTPCFRKTTSATVLLPAANTPAQAAAGAQRGRCAEVTGPSEAYGNWRVPRPVWPASCFHSQPTRSKLVPMRPRSKRPGSCQSRRVLSRVLEPHSIPARAERQNAPLGRASVFSFRHPLSLTGIVAVPFFFRGGRSQLCQGTW